MRRPHLPVVVLLLGLAAPLAAQEPQATPQQLRAAVTRALPLIQKGAAGHRTQRNCFACHHQALPILALTAARSRHLTLTKPPGSLGRL